MKSLELALLWLFLSTFALAQGTQSWQQSKYDEFEKGAAHGVAINRDGSLTLAPAFNSLYTTPSTYLWDLVADAQGNVYAAAGSPARVYRLTPDGKASIIFAPQELQVQAMAIDSSGAIYAATSPDGKVYKIIHGGSAPGKAPDTSHTTAEVAAAQEGAKPAPEGEKPHTSVAVDSSYTASVFFDPKTKYIWTLVFDRQGQLYAGTGDRGEIYRIDRNGAGSVFFKSDEAQIRVLAFDNVGNLIAGTDGSGLIYRISPQGEGFVLYSAPKKEITALAVDRQGNIYAAGAGEKRSTNLLTPGSAQAAPSLPGAGSASAQTSSSVSTAPVGPTTLPYQNIANVGSEIYRLSPEGSPKTLWSSRDDLVYALAFDQSGQLLAGTGNKGKIFALRGTDYTDLAKASANQITAFAAGPKGGVFAVTSNLGKVFMLEPNPVSEGTYESDVFDAKNFSKWGRVEVRGTGNYEIFTRSGNVDNPDRNWSAWKKVDLQKELPADVPAARFIQWKAILRPGKPSPVLDSVTVNYLPKNVAPEVDDVTVLVGFRTPSGTHISTTVSDNGPYDAPLPAIRDKNSIVVKWKAHDGNDDDLLYDVYYRGDGESRWKLLREQVEARYVNLESDIFPDGGYVVKVVASDASSHALEDALTGERESSRFEVDNTPPHIEFLNTKVEGNQVHLTFRAVDTFSPIKRAEYSIDAGDWQLVEPVGQLSDYRIENYDFNVPIPIVNNADTDLTGTPATKRRASRTTQTDEHTIVIRVYDRFENVGINKTVVRTAPSSSNVIR